MLKNRCISNSNLERLTVMKKIYIALAVLAAASLTSCVEEQSFNGHVMGKGEVAFVLQTGPSTKAAEADNPVRKGASIQIGEIGNQSIILSETITDLSFVTPQTKGTPVYTQNVGTLYKDKLGVYANWAEFGEATFETEGKNTDEDTGSLKGWRYFHRYDNAPWPAENAAVGFYMRMPADAVSIPTDGYKSDGKIVFDYTSPVTAAAQQDLIFAYASITEKDNKDAFASGGVPVTFYHALTGVKFAIGNTDKEIAPKSESNPKGKGIALTKVEFINLANTGTCTVNSAAAGTDDGPVSWEADAEADNIISQDFSEVGLTTFAKGENPPFADSFYAAGTSQNVNDADASYTFWLIPQTFPSTSNAVMRISYTMSGRDEHLDISLKDFFGSLPWKAGQLRTFTIKLDEVNVKITDDVTLGSSATAQNGYSGTIKENVKIQNTGDTPAFIRAAIVGQWLAAYTHTEGSTTVTEYCPVFGFTDAVNQLYIVESWYEDQFVNKERNHGHFTGLPGYDQSNPYRNWLLCEDGYYYYTQMVNPGDYTGSDLFDSYISEIIPATIIAGTVMDSSLMHFELEISTQAVTAVKTDGHEGSLYTWDEAWKNATGTKPVKKTEN